MSKAYLVFTDDNQHWMGKILRRGYRHVLTISHEGNGWVIYDWAGGAPQMNVIAEEDIRNWLGSFENEYIEIEAEQRRPVGPLMLNNCVGHAKLLLGIRSWAFTPWQLYKQMKKGFPMKKLNFPDNLFTLPGGGFFGGPKVPPPPPPPPPPPEPPKKADAAVRQARADERKRSRLKSGTAGTIKTDPLLIPEASTTNKTLLGN